MRVGIQFNPRGKSSIDEILDDPKVELVHVLVPMVFHQDVVIKCLEAGKHVLVEKPVAQEVSELKALKAAAEKAGKVCMPAHNYIYTPSIMRAKRLIDEGKLGDICGLWIFFNIFRYFFDILPILFRYFFEIFSRFF